MLSLSALPDALIASVGADESAQLRVVNQSLINETYCLTSYDERFLIKRFLADESTGRSRLFLVTIQKKLAKHGIAPKPIFLCEHSEFYAEEWVTPSLTPVNILPEDQRTKVLAHALARIHRLPLTTARMDLPKQWDGYIRAAMLTESDIRAKRAKELVFLAAASINSADDMVFCHNDLAMNHIINHERLSVIDWEYCSTGNRYFDIASTIAINRLSSSQRNALAAAYAEATGLSAQQVQEGIVRHEPLVTLTYQLWYAAITEHVKQIQ